MAITVPSSLIDAVINIKDLLQEGAAPSLRKKITTAVSAGDTAVYVSDLDSFAHSGSVTLKKKYVNEYVRLTTGAGNVGGTTLVSTGAFTANMEVGNQVTILTGANAGLTRTISANTADQLTVSAAFTGQVLGSVQFRIIPVEETINYVKVSDRYLARNRGIQGYLNLVSGTSRYYSVGDYAQIEANEDDPTAVGSLKYSPGQAVALICEQGQSLFAPSGALTSTGGSTTTVQDTGAFTANQEVGNTVTMTSGLASGESRTIISNTANVLTVSPPFSAAVATDTYTITPAFIQGLIDKINSFPVSPSLTDAGSGKGSYNIEYASYVVTMLVNLIERSSLSVALSTEMENIVRRLAANVTLRPQAGFDIYNQTFLMQNENAGDTEVLVESTDGFSVGNTVNIIHRTTPTTNEDKVIAALKYRGSGRAQASDLGELMRFTAVLTNSYVTGSLVRNTSTQIKSGVAMEAFLNTQDIGVLLSIMLFKIKDIVRPS